MTNRNRRNFAPRKERIWGLTSANGTIAAATAAGMIFVDLMQLLRADLGTNLYELTASAIRLQVMYRLTAGASTDTDTVAMGIGWVSDTAIAAGGAALPDPSTDHFDWMAHDIRSFQSEGASDSEQSPRNAAFAVVNDSMRKQRENHSTLGCVFRGILVQGGGTQVFVGGRVLFLLP